MVCQGKYVLSWKYLVMEFCFVRQLHPFLYRKILRSEKEWERSISFSQLSLSQTKPAQFCFIFVSQKKRWK